jgi:dihydrofolate reductase
MRRADHDLEYHRGRIRRRSGRKSAIDGAVRVVSNLEQLDALKSEAVKNFVVQGSPGLIRALLTARAADEYHCSVQPIVLGGGRAFSSGVAKSLDLRFVELRNLSSGVVLQRYRNA